MFISIVAELRCFGGPLDNYLIKIINPTEKIKIIHYTPVLWGKGNGRLVKANFNSLRIQLYYGKSSSIILSKICRICERKMPSRSVGLTKEVTSIITIDGFQPKIPPLISRDSMY